MGSQRSRALELGRGSVQVVAPGAQLRRDRLPGLVERDRLRAGLGQLRFELRRVERDQHITPIDALPLHELAAHNAALNLRGDAHLGGLELAVGVEEARGQGLRAQEAVPEPHRGNQRRCSCDPSCQLVLPSSSAIALFSRTTLLSGNPRSRSVPKLRRPKTSAESAR